MPIEVTPPAVPVQNSWSGQFAPDLRAECAAALAALKYDTYKGPQYYRTCDHQSVQSVLVIESNSKEARDPTDVFKVLHVEPADEKLLRSCQELGFKG